MNLNQVTLPVKNIAEANTFYLNMGFTQIVDSPHYARFVCPQGQATFSLMLEEGDFCNGAIIYFECEQLDSWYQSLLDKGFVFDQAPEDQPYLWREAVLHDPSGNKIKLYWAGKNRINPPWRVEKRL